MDKNLNTENITKNLIDYIVQKIVSEIQPEKIILFGSYARGDYTQGSDLDLFIIKDSDEPSRMIRRKVDALLRGRKFSVDLIVISLTDCLVTNKNRKTSALFRFASFKKMSFPILSKFFISRDGITIKLTIPKRCRIRLCGPFEKSWNLIHCHRL